MKQLCEFWSEGKFNHQWLEIDHSIEQINPTDSPRYYLVDSEYKYPSVTAVLGYEPNESLLAWKKAVGEVEAARVSKRATDRGSTLHENVENYLLNHKVYIDKRRLFDVQMFKRMIPLLNRIQNIRILEDPVFSHIFSCAGTVDCVGEFDGELSIIDFKTSKLVKNEADIESYWVQTSIYSYAIEEITGLKIDNLVILLSVEDKPAKIYKSKRSKYTKSVQIFQKNALKITKERFH